MKATKEVLESAVGIINQKSKNTYELYYAYDMVQLVRLWEKGGQSPITGFISKSEMAHFLGYLQNYIWSEA